MIALCRFLQHKQNNLPSCTTSNSWINYPKKKLNAPNFDKCKNKKKVNFKVHIIFFKKKNCVKYINKRKTEAYAPKLSHPGIEIGGQ